MAKQIEDIVLRLKQEGFENLDKIRGAFRELNKVTGFTETELQRLRREVLNFDAGVGKNAQSLLGQVNALKALQAQAVAGSAVYRQLGKDVRDLGGAYKEAATGVKTFTDAQLRSQFPGAKASTFGPQIQTLKKDLQELSVYSKQYADTLTTIKRRELPFTIATGRQNVIAAAEAYRQGPELASAATKMPEMPRTNAALAQSIQEITNRLANLVRGTVEWREAANELRRLSREANDGFKFMSSGAIEAKARLDALRTSLKQVGGGFAEFSRNPLQLTQAEALQTSIERNRRKRGLTGAQVSTVPFGPVEPTELFRNIAGIQSQQVTNQLLGRSYKDVATSIREVSASSDGSLNSLRAQRTAWESLRNSLGDNKKALREVDAELNNVDKQIAKRSRGGGRLTGMQFAQAAGAAITGGIYGGPEGFLGGAIGGVAGGVGGAFAGAAIGAQVGMFRQQLGTFATYAAEVRRLQLALQGVVTSFDDYRAALGAINSTSQQFNVPIQQATQQFTKLTAAVVGSGGTLRDAENTFKGLSASVLATGGSVEDINGALVAAAQVFSKGKVSAEELRGQIGERLAGAFALFAESSGLSTRKLDAALKEGEVTIDDFVKFTEFSLAKYGRTARIIAESPEQAGARLNLALDKLKKNVGDSLGPTGATFQDFAARSVRGLDLIISKLIELKAIQPGSDFYVNSVLTGGANIKSIEDQLLQAGAGLRKAQERNLRVGPLVLPTNLAEINDAEKRVRILEKALIDLRIIEKETNKERKQRQKDEDTTKQEKRATSLLSAIEQREEAISQARIQREQQIADIRKAALDQAKQLERQFADERRNLERDLARSTRNTADINADIARQQRILAGEDPRIVEAEQRIADIYREARERDIQIKEEFKDRELTRARTVADFQKNTADQINKANQAYTKSIGAAQRGYARDVGKILDEASGKTGSRLAAAGKLLGLYMQRAALNQRVVESFGVLVSTPGRTGQGAVPAEAFLDSPALKGLPAPDRNRLLAPVRTIIDLDNLIRDAEKRLQSRGPASPGATAERFLAAFAGQPQFENVAGLEPLPLQRMYRQMGRQFTQIYERIFDAKQTPYPYSRREQRQMLAPDPARAERVLNKVQALEAVRQSHDPLEAQWKERQNRQNLNPRSKPALMSLDTFLKVLRDMERGMLFKRGSPLSGMSWSGGVTDDLSDYLSEGQTKVIQKGVRDLLKGEKSKFVRSQLGDLYGESFKSLILKTLEAEGLKPGKGTAPRGGAMSDPLAPLGGDEEWLQQFMERTEPLRVIPGRGLPGFEGASLRKLSRNYGSIATTSLQGLLTRAVPIPVIPQAGAQGASKGLQEAQQGENKAGTQLKITTDQNKLLRILTDQKFRLEDQNKLYQFQQKYIRDGLRPALAETYAQADFDAARLKQTNAELTPIIDDNVRRIKELASAYEAAQRAARLTQDSRIGLGLREGAEQYVQSIGTMREATSQLAQTGLKGIEDAIFSLVTTGTANFRDFAASILKDTARMIIQQLMLRQVMQIVGAIDGGAGNRNDILGSILAGQSQYITPNALGAAYAANGIVPFAKGGVVTRPTMFAFAQGGAFRQGLMGEAGPEAVMPLRRLPSGRLGVESTGGGGGVNVTVNVDASGSDVQGDAGQAQALGRVISAAVQQELIKQRRPGGLLG